MQTNFVLAAAAALAIAAPATAANLVSNGGFESNGGDFSGNITDWNNVSGGHFAATTNFAGVAAYEDSFYASTGCVGSYCTLSQTIATIAGRSYTLSFAFNPGTNVQFGGASTFVTFGGNFVSPDIGVGPLGWNVYSYTVTGSGSDTLSFNSFQDPAYTGIDAVSLISDVPEAATWALMITGFGFVGTAMRRRRVALAA